MRALPNAARSGVTLLELLIAVSLVSLLAVGLLMAMRVGLDAMQKTNQRFASNRRVLGSQRALYQQVSGMIPVLGKCTGTPQVFFYGNPQSMRFVSSHSIEEASRGYPRILEYAVLPDELSRGVRLVVRETYFTGPRSLLSFCPNPSPLALPPQQLPWFVLADRLAYCRLAYLVKEAPNRPPEWMPVHRGKFAPVAIRFQMAPLEPDPSHLQMSAMTVPVRLSKDPLRPYEDIDQQ
jgi:prepilin-type N-terminal cleavage/methylation domain-containing protein